jgi:hypothetical protein
VTSKDALNKQDTEENNKAKSFLPIFIDIINSVININIRNIEMIIKENF